MITLTVTRSAGQYLYPLEVDPEFNVISESSLSENTWPYGAHGTTLSYGYVNEPWLGVNSEGSSGEWNEFYSETKGDSRIYKLASSESLSPTETFGVDETYYIGGTGIYLEADGPNGFESRKVIAEHESLFSSSNELCPAANCSPEVNTEHNSVRLVNIRTENGGGGQVRMGAATVYISQPKTTHSIMSIVGSNWIGPDSGSIEVYPEDAGLGVAEMVGEYYESGVWKVGLV